MSAPRVRYAWADNPPTEPVRARGARVVTHRACERAALAPEIEQEDSRKLGRQPHLRRRRLNRQTSVEEGRSSSCATREKEIGARTRSATRRHEGSASLESMDRVLVLDVEAAPDRRAGSATARCASGWRRWTARCKTRVAAANSVAARCGRDTTARAPQRQPGDRGRRVEWGTRTDRRGAHARARRRSLPRRRRVARRARHRDPADARVRTASTSRRPFRRRLPFARSSASRRAAGSGTASACYRAGATTRDSGLCGTVPRPAETPRRCPVHAGCGRAPYASGTRTRIARAMGVPARARPLRTSARRTRRAGDSLQRYWCRARHARAALRAVDARRGGSRRGAISSCARRAADLW